MIETQNFILIYLILVVSLLSAWLAFLVYILRRATKDHTEAVEKLLFYFNVLRKGIKGSTD